MEKEEKKIKKNVRCRFNEQEYIGLQGCYQDVYHSLISKTQYLAIMVRKEMDNIESLGDQGFGRFVEECTERERTLAVRETFAQNVQLDGIDYDAVREFTERCKRDTGKSVKFRAVVEMLLVRRCRRNREQGVLII